MSPFEADDVPSLATLACSLLPLAGNDDDLALWLRLQAPNSISSSDHQALSSSILPSPSSPFSGHSVAFDRSSLEGLFEVFELDLFFEDRDFNLFFILLIPTDPFEGVLLMNPLCSCLLDSFGDGKSEKYE